MPGVRLVHDSQRGGTVVIEDPTRAYPVPLMCHACGVVHEKKTYHLEVDGEGAMIVSWEVFERLRKAGMPGLKARNSVRHPPPQRIGIEVAKNKLLLPRKVK